MWVAAAPIKEGRDSAADRVDYPGAVPPIARNFRRLSSRRRSPSSASSGRNISSSAAQRFRHDPIDDPEAEQFRGGQPQGFGGLRRVLAIAPQDRGAALRRDHG